MCVIPKGLPEKPCFDQFVGMPTIKALGGLLQIKKYSTFGSGLLCTHLWTSVHRPLHLAAECMRITTWEDTYTYLWFSSSLLHWRTQAQRNNFRTENWKGLRNPALLCYKSCLPWKTRKRKCNICAHHENELPISLVYIGDLQPFCAMTTKDK